IKGDASVARSERSAAHPQHGAGREQGIEIALVVTRDPRWQDARLEIRRRHEGSLELRDRVEQSGLAGARRVDAVPAELESRDGALLDRLAPLLDALARA